MNKAYRHVYKDGIGWVAIAENASCVSSSKGSGTVPGKTKVEVLKNFFDLRNSVVLNNGFLLKGLFAATLFCGVFVGDLKAEVTPDITRQQLVTQMNGNIVYTTDGGDRVARFVKSMNGYIDGEGRGYIDINGQWYKVDSYDERGVITLRNGKRYVLPTGTLARADGKLSEVRFFEFGEKFDNTGKGANKEVVRYDTKEKKWYVYNQSGDEKLYAAKSGDSIKYFRIGYLKKNSDGTLYIGPDGYYVPTGVINANEQGRGELIDNLNLIKTNKPDIDNKSPDRLSLVGLDGKSTTPQKYKDDDKEVKDHKREVDANKDGNIRLGNVARALQDDEAVNLGQLNEKLEKIPYVSINASKKGDGSNYDSKGATGKDSIAIGPSTTATDTNATAIGHKASAQKPNAIAIGANAQANAKNVVAIGESAGKTEFDNGSGSVFIGRNAGKNSNIIDPQGAKNWGSVYIGQDSGINSKGDGNIYMGSSAGINHQGSQNIFLGDGARNLKDQQGSGDNEITKGNRNIAIGNQYVHNPAKVYRKKYGEDDALNDTITIGTATRASANGAIAIGSAYNYDYDERSKNTYYIATSANGVRSIALGSGILVNSKNGVAIGFGSGISDEKVTDAVALGSYSKADRKALDASTKKSVYLVDDAEVVKTVANTKGAISVGSTIEGLDEKGNKVKPFTRQITNVAAGTEDADAVNVAQLKALQNNGFYTEANLTVANADKVENKKFKHTLGETIKVGGNFKPSDGTVLDTTNMDKYLSGENLATSINNDGSINLLMAKTPKFDDISISKDGDGKNYTNLTQWLKKIESSSSTSTGDKIKYFSVKSKEEGNENNDGAKGNNSIAIGPNAKAGDSSVAIGLSARTGGKGVIDRYSYKTLKAFNDKLQRNIDEAVKKRDEAVENYNKAVTYPSKSIYERIKNKQEELINKYEKIKAKYEKMIGSYEGRYEYDGRLIAKAEFDKLSKDEQSKIKQTLKYISSNTFYENSVAIGHDAHTLSSDAVAIGNGAKVISNGGVAIGQGSVSDARTEDLEGYEPLAFNIIKNNIFEKNHQSTWVATDQPFAVGDDRSKEKITRQITGVAAGKKDTDAVNVAQLKQIGFKAAGDTGKGVIQNENGENNILNIKTNGSWENKQTNIVYTGKNLETKFTPYYTDQMKNKVYSTFAIAMTDTPRFKSITIADENTVNQDGKVVDKSDNSPIELKKFGGKTIGFAGENDSTIKLTNLADGTIGENSKDAITGGQIQKIIKGGLKFTANSGEHTAELGSTVSVKGAGTDWTKFDNGANIMTQIDNQGNIVVGLSKDLKDITSIENGGKTYTFGDATLGDTSVITNKDLTTELKNYVTTGDDKTAEVSVEGDGLKLDSDKTTNVAKYKLSLDKDVIKKLAGTEDLDKLKNEVKNKADIDAENVEGENLTNWQKKLGVSELSTTINNFNTNGMFEVTSKGARPGVAVKPNAVVDFTAGKVGTDKNLIVSHEKTDSGIKVNYTLNTELENINSIGGNGKTVSFTNDGVDFSGAKIKNVAQGSDDTDGVNLKQVRTLIANVGTTNLVQVRTSSPMSFILDKKGKPIVQLVKAKDPVDNKTKLFDAKDVNLLHPITDGDGNFADGTGKVGDQIKISPIHPGYGVTVETKITNVKVGKVTSDSLEAINGSQLYDSNKAIADILGGGSTLNDKGVVTKPTYNITNKDGSNITHNTIGGALTELNKFNKNFTDNGLFSVLKDGEAPLKIKPNENISFVAGGSNLDLTVEKGASGKGAKITYSLKDELKGITSIASKTNKPLKVTSNGEDFYFNNTDGTDKDKKRNVATMGDLASIDGNTTALKKAVAGGNKLNSDGTISQNANSTKTPFDPIKTASNPNGDTKAKTLFETVNNTIAAINEGFYTEANLTASADTNRVKHQLGSTIKVGGTSNLSIDKLSGENLATSINEDGSINLLMSKAPRFDSVNIGGNENNPDSGIKIAQGKDGKNGNILELSKKGADGKDGIILRGLANGKDGSDAVTKAQLDEVRDLANNSGANGIKNARFTTDDSKEAKFDENNKLAVNGDENIKTSTTDKGIKISLGDKIGFGNKVATKDKDGNEVKVSPVELGKDGLKITQDDGTAGPSVTKDGIDGGNKKLTNLASGLGDRSLDEIKADIKKANGDKAKMPKEVGNAATIGDLASVDSKITNIANKTNKINVIGGSDNELINEDGTLTKKGQEVLTTNAASGQDVIKNKNIIQAINNINKQGTRFFHVNDGKPIDGKAKGDEKDSSADSKGGVAIGMQAKVGNNAENAISIGTESQVSVAGGVALGSYSQANRKALSDVEKQKVYLVKNTDVANTVKNTKGAISVGKSGENGFTRQITGVAAGTEDSDAVNVAQLKAVEKVVSQGSKWIAADDRKFDKNGKIVVNDAKAEAKGVNSVAIGAGSNTEVMLNGNKVDRPNTVSVGGINKDGTVTQRTISNVAPGVLNSDAATMGQLRAGLNDVYGKLGEYKKDASAGTASALAVGNLPQATIPGKGMVSLGSGFYDGQSAMAIGLSKMSDDGKWVFKGSASYDSQEKAGAALSVGFHF